MGIQASFRPSAENWRRRELHPPPPIHRIVFICAGGNSRKAPRSEMSRSRGTLTLGLVETVIRRPSLASPITHATLVRSRSTPPPPRPMASGLARSVSRPRRPSSVAGRMMKWVERHRAVASLRALAVGVTVLGIVGTAWRRGIAQRGAVELTRTRQVAPEREVDLTQCAKLPSNARPNWRKFGNWLVRSVPSSLRRRPSFELLGVSLSSVAAMAGDGDEQMSLAKSMSEKIDDADMQRSWSKVKSLTDKKKPPKKRSIPTLADMAADAKPDALDTLEAEAQLLARTILERQRKPVPASAMPDIISLSERLAQADEGMWGAARSMAFREEPAPVEVEAAKVEEWMAAVAKAEPLVGTFTVTDGNGTVLAEMTNPISVVGVNDTITVNPTVAVDGGKPAVLGPKLKVHVPEPAKTVHAVFDDIEFDDALIAKMMANIAANGMSLEDLAH